MAGLSGHWVTIRAGAVLLWAAGWNSPLCTIVPRGAQYAQVQGDAVIVQFTDGRAMEYRITRCGSNAVPVRRLN